MMLLRFCMRLISSVQNLLMTGRKSSRRKLLEDAFGGTWAWRKWGAMCLITSCYIHLPGVHRTTEAMTPYNFQECVIIIFQLYHAHNFHLRLECSLVKLTYPEARSNMCPVVYRLILSREYATEYVSICTTIFHQLTLYAPRFAQVI